MPGLFLNRRRMLGVAVVAVVVIVGLRWLYQPDRQLRRAWDNLLDSVEARNTTRLGRIVADDYQDRWGYNRRTLLDDARLAFFSFEHLELRGEQMQFSREGDTATVTAILRVEADGPVRVADARAEVNGLFTPFRFSWRREPGWTGSWKLISFDHPEFDLGRYQRQWR